jgi:hypothetical protein
MVSKENEGVYKRIAVLTPVTIVSILGVLAIVNNVEDNNFKRLVPESVVLDSTYKVRSDSLRNDFYSKMNALKEVYELRKEQE